MMDENTMNEIIACSYNHAIIKNKKNEVFVFGNNYYGQLGTGDYLSRNVFEKIDFDFNGEIVNIVCGGCHTIIQNDKGEIYASGSNCYGQLGLNDNKGRKVFEKIPLHINGKIKKISCGYHHTVIQNDRGEIYSCGYNKRGQLGFSDHKKRKIFSKVNFGGNIIDSSCGLHCTMIQNDENEIFICGNEQNDICDEKTCDHIANFTKVNFDCHEKMKNIFYTFHYTAIQNEKGEIFISKKEKDVFEQFIIDDGKTVKNVFCHGSYLVVQYDGGEICIYDFNADTLKKISHKFDGDIKNMVCGESNIIVQNDQNELFISDVKTQEVFDQTHDYFFDLFFVKIEKNECDRILKEQCDLKLNMDEITL